MAKHGLRKIWILKDQIGLIWGKRYGRRREEEERKKKKRKRKKREEPRSSKAKLQIGMELLTLSRDPWFCLVNGYLLYPNLGFVRISS